MNKTICNHKAQEVINIFDRFNNPQYLKQAAGRCHYDFLKKINNNIKCRQVGWCNDDQKSRHWSRYFELIQILIQKKKKQSLNAKTKTRIRKTFINEDT